jgi:hypothetical protein
MSGPGWLATIPEIEAYWARHATAAGIELPAGWEGRSTLIDTKTAVSAYVSADRWVADCPHCSGGIAAWSENPRGACLSCGRIYRIRFPKARRKIETVLAKRRPANRHWLLGETVDQLAVENLEHGMGVR